MSDSRSRTPCSPSGSFGTSNAGSGSFRTAPAPSAHLEKYCVLVVDDEPTVLSSLHALLCDDVELTTCGSAERALELLKSASFHVVISDFALPGMNGNDLFRKVRALPQFISCLLITGSDSYEQPLGKEPHYVLLKPFDPERLIAMVMQLGRVAEMKRAVQRLGSSMAGKGG